ncbi:hypothetical protein PV327_010921 [Microctonus hyperodae]|uniref:Uncharacterized protein n=1 Tax=Microctonus hyperodae TaxID=165561 RepID=A0AA39F0G8_MICHY|nr:hypothetical protein PV327_010921 [Microctonus hyperodae]
MEVPQTPAELLSPPLPVELDPDANRIVQEIGEVIADMAEGRETSVPVKTKIPVIKSRYRSPRGSWQLSDSDNQVTTIQQIEKPPGKVRIRPYTGAITKAIEASTSTQKGAVKKTKGAVKSTKKAVATKKATVRSAAKAVSVKEKSIQPSAKAKVTATNTSNQPRVVADEILQSKIPVQRFRLPESLTVTLNREPMEKLTGQRRTIFIPTPPTTVSTTAVVPSGGKKKIIMQSPQPRVRPLGGQIRMIPLITIPDSPARPPFPETNMISAAVATITAMDTTPADMSTTVTTPAATASTTSTPAATATTTPTPATTPSLPAPPTGGKRKPKRSCRNNRHGLRYHHDGVALWKATRRGGVLEWAEVTPKNA